MTTASIAGSITLHSLEVRALTAQSFSPFGDVIETQGRHHFPINGGKVQRFHDLAQVDVLDSGKPGISLFVAEPYAMPLELAYLERHPRSSQAFIPLDERPFLLVVAPAHAQPSLANMRAFLTDGKQGVNYRRGVWHHVLIAVGRQQTFAVIDRIGDGPNCDIFELDGENRCCVDLPAAR